MIRVEEFKKNKAAGSALIEEVAGFAPTIGLFSGLKIIGFCVAKRVGNIYRWSFEWDPAEEVRPDGAIIMENGDLAIFKEKDMDPWLKFVLKNIQRLDVSCTLQQYVESEFLDDAHLIELLYIDCLGRPADPGGMTAYLSRLKEGINWSDVRANLLGSEECANRGLTVFNRLGRLFRFQSLLSEQMRMEQKFPRNWIDLRHYKSFSDEEFCTDLYERLLGRAPDEAGLRFYSWAIGSNRMSRRKAIARILKDNKMMDDWIILPLDEIETPFEVVISESASREAAAKAFQDSIRSNIDAEKLQEWTKGEAPVEALIDMVEGWDPYFRTIAIKVGAEP